MGRSKINSIKIRQASFAISWEQVYVPRYGMPEVLICDNDLEFKNNTVVPYLEALGMEVRYSSP